MTVTQDYRLSLTQRFKKHIAANYKCLYDQKHLQFTNT